MGDGELVELALEFARRVNDLQRRYAPLLPEARREGRMDALLTGYRKEAGALYRRWLTQRKRRCYAPLPDPPMYAALEKLTLSTVKRKGNWAAVEVLTGEGCLDFRFVLFNQGREWRIDRYQQRYRSAYRVERWSEGIF